MKKYENLDNLYERNHLIETTFQLGKYKGTIRNNVGGNCFGLDVLQFDAETLDINSMYFQNNCGLEISENDEGELWFTCVLTSDDGETIKHEDELRYLNDLVVKLEIIDCTIVK